MVHGVLYAGPIRESQLERCYPIVEAMRLNSSADITTDIHKNLECCKAKGTWRMSGQFRVSFVLSSLSEFGVPSVSVDAMTVKKKRVGWLFVMRWIREKINPTGLGLH